MKTIGDLIEYGRNRSPELGNPCIVMNQFTGLFLGRIVNPNSRESHIMSQIFGLPVCYDGYMSHGMIGYADADSVQERVREYDSIHRPTIDELVQSIELVKQAWNDSLQMTPEGYLIRGDASFIDFVVELRGLFGDYKTE